METFLLWARPVVHAAAAAVVVACELLSHRENETPK